MKELSNKVFKTIFLIITAFVLFGIVVYNINSYKKEYDNVHRNLTFMEEKEERREKKPEYMSPKDKDFDSMMIMDYEVYTVKINNKKIEKIISHSNSESGLNVRRIAKAIINKGAGLKVGNLYNNKYSYNYNKDVMVIINTTKINKKLLLILIRSIIVFIGAEAVIYLASKSLTKRITKPAKESFDKQRNFIADASHELKTPLAVIMASSDEIKSDKKNEKYIDNIKHESEKMNNLIKSLLDLSKLESSGLTYNEENLSKIVEKTSLTFEAVAFENNVNINTNIKDNVIFRCNKDEIERLIGVILDNAIKHSYKNSTIKVNLFKDKNSINLDIINSGDPIKPGDEIRIFERFYRADKSRSRKENRYGLGLAIAKTIVDKHGGIIKAFSKNGKTTFKIVFKK